jgi:hypothetical protein
MVRRRRQFSAALFLTLFLAALATVSAQTPGASRHGTITQEFPSEGCFYLDCYPDTGWWGCVTPEATLTINGQRYRLDQSGLEYLKSRLG